MATLRHQRSSQSVILRAHHIFGRSTSAHTQLISKDCSRLHAQLQWDQDRWHLIDRSQNGTWLDGKRVPCNQPMPIETSNTSMRFGQKADSLWLIESLCPPRPMLVSHQSEPQTLVLNNVHLLPSEAQPLVCVYRDIQGRWVSESAKESRLLNDNDWIICEDLHWQFFSGQADAATQEKSQPTEDMVEKLHCLFKVSQNEEHVRLQLQFEDQSIDLKERSHHYLLLHLARKRIQDAENGWLDAECGWIDIEVLTQELGVKETHLNIQIFRARKQFDKKISDQRLPETALLAPVVERRTRQVRFSYPRISIERAGLVEAIDAKTKRSLGLITPASAVSLSDSP